MWTCDFQKLQFNEIQISYFFVDIDSLQGEWLGSFKKMSQDLN